MKRFVAAVGLFFLMLLPLFHPLQAEDAAEVSLEKALEIFYAQNYDIIIHRYEIDKSYGDYVAAKIVPNPFFSVNYTGLGPGFSKMDNTQLIYRLDQLIELGGKRGYRMKSATEGLEATKLGHQDAIRTLLIGFYTAYYNLILGDLNLEYATEELKRFDRILLIAEKRHAAGFLSVIDYTKLKLARLDLENSLLVISTQYRNDMEAFRLLLGGTSAYKPIRPVVHGSFPSHREESLLETAYANRFDLLALERQLKSVEASQDLAKAQRIPDVTLGAEYGRYGRDTEQGVGGGVGISIPLFYRNQGEILKKTAEYNQTKVQIARTRKQIEVDVRQGLNNYVSGVKVFDGFKARKAEMDELLGRSEKAFSLGGITVLDLLDTQKTYKEFVTKYNQAFTQSELNKELLKVYTGEIK
jgi:outer membrane protein, heavy metal efflux system